MDGGAGSRHVPVLLREVVTWLQPACTPPAVVLDCTVGAGGHAEALLAAVPGLRLVGLDRDGEAILVAAGRLTAYGDRVRLMRANFADLTDAIEEVAGDGEVAGVLYDLGVSSLQLDDAERGFGYRPGAGLDMRMDRTDSRTAADVVNTYPEADLARVLARFGEERFASRIARAIVRRRERRPFADAPDLAEVVRAAIPAATRRTGPHPARRTFQALRIEVNQELRALETSLPQAVAALRPGGRLAVISFHSLEDRIVKRFLADQTRGCRCPRDFPICVCGRRAVVRVLTRRPVRPSPEEVASNPRSDSARLRVAEKLEEAA